MKRYILHSLSEEETFLKIAVWRYSKKAKPKLLHTKVVTLLIQKVSSKVGFSALISTKCGVLMKLSIWHYCRRGLQEFIGLLGEMKLTLPGYYQVLQNCSGKGRYVSTFEAFEKLNIDNWFFSDQGRLDFKSINVCFKAW